MVRRMSENKEFKETDIGCVPREWDLCNFGENSKIKARIGWQGLTTKEYKNSGDYFLITGTDFENNNIKWETCHYVDKFRYDQDVNIQVKDNDILITKDGTIGKVAFVDNMTKPATLNSGVFVIRPINSCYEPKFLFYVLKSFYFDKFLKQLTAGSTINHLYQKDIVKFNFVCPSIEEQKAIATALSDMDNLILSLEKLIDKKKMIKEGAMEELLTGKKRLDGFNEKWENICLGKILKFQTGYPFKSQYFNQKVKGIRLIKNRDLKNDDQIYYYSGEYSNEYIVNNGDVLVSMDGDFMTCLWKKNKALLNQRVGRIIKVENIDINFIRYRLIKPLIELQRGTCATTVKHLSHGDIENMELYMPVDVLEQKAIANILLDMDDEIERLEKKLDKYKNIKAGMMEELLTGKRRLI